MIAKAEHGTAGRKESVGYGGAKGHRARHCRAAWPRKALTLGLMTSSMTRSPARVAALARERGSDASVHIADVSKLDRHQGDDRRIPRRAHGRIDILDQQRHIPTPEPARCSTRMRNSGTAMMDLSLKGYFFASQRAAQGDGPSGERRKRIVCLASVHAFRALDRTGPRTASPRLRLRRMVKGLAVDLAGTGIRA